MTDDNKLQQLVLAAYIRLQNAIRSINTGSDDASEGRYTYRVIHKEDELEVASKLLETVLKEFIDEALLTDYMTQQELWKARLEEKANNEK